MEGFIEKTSAHDLRWPHFIWLVFGLPVEVEPPPLRSRPWAVDALGLISADLWRHHGLTFMT